VVIGALYNGQGREDAQGNRIAAGAADASGQSPAWFPGQKAAEVAGRTWPGHQHPAALAGVKSQELNHTRSGGGGYNQIVFDDSPGAGRLEVYSSTAQTRLQLGHLRHQVDNRLLQTRGHGLDLATQAWGAVRAASGLLLSAHARPSSTASTATHDAREAVGLLVSAAERQRVLSHSAQRQQVRLPDEPDVKLAAQDTPPRPDPDGKSEPALQATLAVEALTRSLSGEDEASPAGADDDEGMGGGEGRAAKWRDPDLVGSAPAGVVWHTPAHATLSADGSVSVTAGQGLDLVAQQGLSAHARGGLSLYTEGREAKGEAAGKPDKSRGLKLHARQGVLSAQSQNGRTDVAARKRVDMFSCEDTLTIAGKAGVLLAAGGAGIEITQGAIHLKGPGSVLFKASQKIYNPGGGAGHGFQSLPGPIELGPVCHEQFQAVNPVNGRPVAGMPYRIVLADGQELAGRTDAEGKTMPVTTLNSKGVQLFWEPESFPDEPEHQDYIPDC
jgi:type VI secretion system secreted protein VgrG